MTDLKPALKRYSIPDNRERWVLASDIPPAILNATKEELAALAVFAEAMPELLDIGIQDPGLCMPPANSLCAVWWVARNRALAAAKSTTAEEGK